jgi:hypothetical protein
MATSNRPQKQRGRARIQPENLLTYSSKSQVRAAPALDPSSDDYKTKFTYVPRSAVPTVTRQPSDATPGRRYVILDRIFQAGVPVYIVSSSRDNLVSDHGSQSGLYAFSSDGAGDSPQPETADTSATPEETLQKARRGKRGAVKVNSENKSKKPEENEDSDQVADATHHRVPLDYITDYVSPLQLERFENERFKNNTDNALLYRHGSERASTATENDTHDETDPFAQLEKKQLEKKRVGRPPKSVEPLPKKRKMTADVAKAIEADPSTLLRRRTVAKVEIPRSSVDASSDAGEAASTASNSQGDVQMRLARLAYEFMPGTALSTKRDRLLLEIQRRKLRESSTATSSSASNSRPSQLRQTLISQPTSLEPSPAKRVVEASGGEEAAPTTLKSRDDVEESWSSHKPMSVKKSRWDTDRSGHQTFNLRPTSLEPSPAQRVLQTSSAGEAAPTTSSFREVRLQRESLSASDSPIAGPSTRAAPQGNVEPEEENAAGEADAAEEEDAAAEEEEDAAAEEEEDAAAEEEEVYEVSHIISHTDIRGVRCYLVAWVGYHEDEATWLTEEELEGAKDILNVYLHGPRLVEGSDEDYM